MAQSRAKVLRVSFDISDNSCRLFCNVQCSAKMGFSYSLLFFTDKTLPGLLQFCEMKQQKKTVHNLALTHLSGLSLPVASFGQDIMSSCSLIHHKRVWWLSTPHNQKPQLTRAHTDMHTAPRAPGHRDPPSLALGAVDRERKRSGLPEGGKSALVFTHLLDGVLILQATCFFPTKPNSFLSLTAAAQPQPLAGNPSQASSPCRPRPPGIPSLSLSLCSSVQLGD